MAYAPFAWWNMWKCRKRRRSKICGCCELVVCALEWKIALAELCKENCFCRRHQQAHHYQHCLLQHCHQQHHHEHHYYKQLHDVVADLRWLIREPLCFSDELPLLLFIWFVAFVLLLLFHSTLPLAHSLSVWFVAKCSSSGCVPQVWL